MQLSPIETSPYKEKTYGGQNCVSNVSLKSRMAILPQKQTIEKVAAHAPGSNHPSATVISCIRFSTFH